MAVRAGLLVSALLVGVLVGTLMAALVVRLLVTALLVGLLLVAALLVAARLVVLLRSLLRGRLPVLLPGGEPRVWGCSSAWRLPGSAWSGREAGPPGRRRPCRATSSTCPAPSSGPAARRSG
ncbi:hypothetical protein STENM327S_06202 [Streptomyces tendae]